MNFGSVADKFVLKSVK